MINEQKKYDNLIDDLKKLPKVNAPQNFETDLWRKINSAERSKKESFWSKVFTSRKLIPAAAVLASAIIIFFLLDIKPGKTENLLNLHPALKEDKIIMDKSDEKMTVPLPESKRIKVEKQEFEEQKTVVMPKTAVTDQERMLNEEVPEIKDNAIAGGSDAESLKAQQQTIMGRSVTNSLEKISVSESKKDSLDNLKINPSIKAKKEIEQQDQQKKGVKKPKSR